MISDEKFPKKEHLIKTKDFRRIYKEGSVFKKEAFLLYLLANKSAANRVGFVVSARNVKLASRRNRVKRLLRESYRRMKKDLKKGFDIVVVVKKDPARKAVYNEVAGLFLRLAKASNLLLK